jgi:hypothetical protein
LRPGIDLDNSAELFDVLDQTAHAMEHRCTWITTDRDFGQR